MVEDNLMIEMVRMVLKAMGLINMVEVKRRSAGVVVMDLYLLGNNPMVLKAL